VSESSQTGDAEPFDAEEFARQTTDAIEIGGYIADAQENRVIRLEEIIAARWPRSWLLRRRLARELRASVARYPEDLIPRGDFQAGRIQAVSEQLHLEKMERDRRWEEYRQQRDAELGHAKEPGGADPGEGFLT
jgi:hypothetical protein